MEGNTNELIATGVFVLFLTNSSSIQCVSSYPPYPTACRHPHPLAGGLSNCVHDCKAILLNMYLYPQSGAMFCLSQRSLLAMSDSQSRYSELIRVLIAGNCSAFSPHWGTWSTANA